MAFKFNCEANIFKEIALLWERLGYGEWKKLNDKSYLLFFQNTKSFYNHIHLQNGVIQKGVATHSYNNLQLGKKRRAILSDIYKSCKTRENNESALQLKIIEIVNLIWDRSGYFDYEQEMIGYNQQLANHKITQREYNEHMNDILGAIDTYFSNDENLKQFLCIGKRINPPHVEELSVKRRESVSLRTSSGDFHGVHCTIKEHDRNKFRDNEHDFVLQMYSQRWPNDNSINYYDIQSEIRQSMIDRYYQDQTSLEDALMNNYDDYLKTITPNKLNINEGEQDLILDDNDIEDISDDEDEGEKKAKTNITPITFSRKRTSNSGSVSSDRSKKQSKHEPPGSRSGSRPSSGSDSRSGSGSRLPSGSRRSSRSGSRSDSRLPSGSSSGSRPGHARGGYRKLSKKIIKKKTIKNNIKNKNNKSKSRKNIKTNN